VRLQLSVPPLKVRATELASKQISMATVADQMRAMKELIGHHCHLPPMAFGGIGEVARLRYAITATYRP
jgi:hypothetical protein